MVFQGFWANHGVWDLDSTGTESAIQRNPIERVQSLIEFQCKASVNRAKPRSNRDDCLGYKRGRPECLRRCHHALLVVHALSALLVLLARIAIAAPNALLTRLTYPASSAGLRCLLCWLCMRILRRLPGSRTLLCYINR